MTSNREKAAEVIWDAQASGLAKPSDLADALEDEGLLAPDLPEPTRVGPDFTHWGPVALERDTGAIAIGVSGPYTQDPDEARAWAKYLAAAADHAEKAAAHVGKTLGDTDD